MANNDLQIKHKHTVVTDTVNLETNKYFRVIPHIIDMVHIGSSIIVRVNLPNTRHATIPDRCVSQLAQSCYVITPLKMNVSDWSFMR